MKTQFKIIFISIIFGILAWLLDTVLDYFIFYEGSFWGLLILDIPPHELYIRSLIMICFLIFGIITGKGEGKRKRAESELSKLSIAVEQSPSAVMISDKNNNIEYVNHKFVQVTGYSSQEVIGKNPRILKSGEKQPGEYKALWETLIAGREWRGEFHNRKKNGELFWVYASIAPIKNAHGRTTHYLAIKEDITERKKAEEEFKKLQYALRLEKRKLEQVLSIDQKISSILDLNHLVDFVIDKATEILEADKCSLMLLDESSQELLIRGSKGLDDEIIKNTRIKMGDQIAGRVAQEGKPFLVRDIESNSHISRKNRLNYRSRSFMSVPIKLQGKLVGVVNVSDKKSKKYKIFTEVDLRILCTIVRQAAIAIENASYYRELEYLSTTDSLTGIYNHRYFIKRLDQEITRSRRYPKPLCLLMIDIDDFKAYNDTYGHLEGDNLLREVSRVLKEGLRGVDVICRYAGDEFVAILPETGISQGDVIAKKIKTSMNTIDSKCPITFSIGMARCAANHDRRDLIMKADQALYQAKRSGQRICCLD